MSNNIETLLTVNGNLKNLFHERDKNMSVYESVVLSETAVSSILINY